MIDVFSTSQDKMKAITILGICALLTLASTVVGIDDNPPAVILSIFTAIAIVLIFVLSARTKIGQFD